MKPNYKNPNLYIVIFIDILLFSLSYVAAYLIRFDFQVPVVHLKKMSTMIFFIVPFKTLVFLVVGVYQGMWRYLSIEDLLRLFKATIYSTIFIVIAIIFFNRFTEFSRAVFILDWGLTFLLTSGFRLFIRIVYQKGSLLGSTGFHNSRKRSDNNVLIIGAGDTGEKILREIVANRSLNYNIVGFIDDNPKKKGLSIHSVPVLGSLEAMPNIVDKFHIKEVLIAVPSATGAQMQRFLESCKKCGLNYKTMPGWAELIDGKVSVKMLRDINYRDLLRREPVVLDTEQISGYLKNKCIVVTGAGGSIGSELCRQITRFEPEKIILVDKSESALYAIQMEFKHQLQFHNYVTILGDIANNRLMDRTFDYYRPQVVFHAAAYKHVPMLQRNPWEAINNNIRGSYITMEKAVKYNTGYFVLVSTDKAVRPTNIMGASKRVCELLMQSFVGMETRFMAVRFGNVVGSSGSVIPLFREQIEKGGPVTVTHPEVTRYFMTISEASQLILQAGSLGEGGEIFVLEMGTAVKIADMAKDLIRLSGKVPGKDIEIAYTGLRPGEKLYEELITEGEGIVRTEHEKIMVIKSNGYFRGYDGLQFKMWLLNEISQLYKLADEHDGCGILEKLSEILPEYKPLETECVL